MGKTETKWQIIVADITDSVLLGLDILQHLKAVIDLAYYTVKLTIRPYMHQQKGTNLGTAVEIDEVLENHNPEQNSITARQISKDRNHSEKNRRVPLAVQSIQHQLQDVISIQESNWMKGWSWKTSKKEQEDDPDLKTLINWLHTGEPPSEHELQLESPATKHWWNCKTQLKFVKGHAYSTSGWIQQSQEHYCYFLNP
ncbi:unnamed protein product [Mytilus coruscus]|uniref:Uncharacterized protein n=1 Tax=Mytilus coruscus TaxID=42192 RepID=A0A6J8AHZ7_MYTCO|nr:unnamed protein product [Mytilus coruscus]